MKRITTYILICTACLNLLSCSDWLDITPRQFVAEEDLFSVQTGFQEALIGAYQLAARSNLYGARLTFDFLDALAQRYFFQAPVGTTDPLDFQDSAFYNFRGGRAQSTIDAIWRDMYNAIANINNLIYWLEKNGHVVYTENMWEIIMGEALALRSYLYFDLLRMFGPVFKNDPTRPSIVWRTRLNREPKDLLPANVVIENILADLHEARELLDGRDPLNFEFVGRTGADIEEDPFLVFRFKRMNTLAVKALLARVYLWKGDNANARYYALQVRNSGKFRLMTDNFNNFILPHEIIFGLHVDRLRDNVTNSLTQHAIWVISNRDFFNDLFNVAVDGENDFRVRTGWGFELVENRTFIMNKFNQTGLELPMENTMPLIRLPEMYYILSETSETLDEATRWLNYVRMARGSLPLPTFPNVAEKRKQIGIEYRKEFYGEGQLWFYYKRIGACIDEFFNLNTFMTTWTDENFIFPTPEAEILFGGITR